MRKYSNEELWNYLHEQMDVSAKLELEAQIKVDSELMNRIDDMKALDADIREHVTSTAPVGFADKFMSEFASELNLSNEPLQAKVNTLLIRSIIIFFLVTLSGCLIFLISQMKFDPSAVSAMPLNFDAAKDAIPADLVQNSLIGLFLLTSLLFLDRYLASRRILAI